MDKRIPQAKHSPVLYHYLKKYQDDPNSRVFAPLAEAYRKAGLIDEAVEIAREGIKKHPGFIGGRVALARALFDRHEYELVIQEMSPIVRDIPDNLIAQRLMAESCLLLGRTAEALDSYKMLLYFHPDDRDTARMVEELETEAYEKGTLVLRKDLKKEEPRFSIVNAQDAISSDPGLQRKSWIAKIERLQSVLLKVERYRSNAR